MYLGMNEAGRERGLEGWICLGYISEKGNVSLFSIPYSQEKGTGLCGCFVLPLTWAREEVLD